MDYALLGKQIRRQRQNMGWTQEQLAEVIGVSTSFIGHIERGTRKASIDTLVEIANAMQVSADFLLGANLSYVHAGMIPKHLTSSQKLVLQEIIGTLQEQIGKWDAQPEEEDAD